MSWEERRKKMLAQYSEPKIEAFRVEEKDANQRDLDMKEMVRRLCPGFETVKNEEFEVVVLQGGLTNQLYLIKHGDKPAGLVRLYGLNTEILIDRKEESIVFHILSEKKFGPKLFGLFENGRVEGFIPSVALEPEQMNEHARMIAAELSRMHYLEMPLSKDPHLWSFLHKFNTLTLDLHTQLEDEKDKQRYEALNMPMLRKRLEQLEMEIPSARNQHGQALEPSNDAEKLAMDFLFEVTFCHNDLLSGNILHVGSENRMQFIDFEYGKYNHRGFEFGNHFNEYQGFEFDSSKYPTRKEQIRFLESYIAGAASKKVENMIDLHATLQQDPAFAQEFYTECIQWIDKFAMASNFMWGLWALVQKVNSPIDFDYLDYARLRLQAVPLE